MFTLAILSVLTWLAVPKYQHYLERARYYEVVQAGGPLKLAVEICFQTVQDLAPCHNGMHGIPNEQQIRIGLVDHGTIQHGQITLVPQERYGFTHQDDYILTPVVNAAGFLDWQISGGALSRGLVISP